MFLSLKITIYQSAKIYKGYHVSNCTLTQKLASDWYWLVQIGTGYYRLVQVGTELYTLIQIGSDWYSLVQVQVSKNW